MSDQRTKEWFQVREGKFTSSAINRLMGIKGLNEGGKTYAFELAIEIVQGRNEDDGFESFDMQRGTELEPYAFIKFSQLMAIRFSEVTKCGFIELNENTGGSPDGLVDDDGVLEIKCPTPKVFFKLVLDGIIDQKHYDQMQHQMYCTRRKKAYYFNYIIYNGVELYHLIEVPRDTRRIWLIRSRINEAVVLRDKYAIELNNNKQF